MIVFLRSLNPQFPLNPDPKVLSPQRIKIRQRYTCCAIKLLFTSYIRDTNQTTLVFKIEPKKIKANIKK